MRFLWVVLRLCSGFTITFLEEEEEDCNTSRTFRLGGERGGGEGQDAAGAEGKRGRRRRKQTRASTPHFDRGSDRPRRARADPTPPAPLHPRPLGMGNPKPGTPAYEKKKERNRAYNAAKRAAQKAAAVEAVVAPYKRKITQLEKRVGG